MRQQGTPSSEGFHDYTVATTWEKFSAAIENALRSLVTKGLPRQAELEQGSSAPLALSTRLHHHLPFRRETYSLTLHLPPLLLGDGDGQAAARGAWPLSDQPHKLQEWFFAGPCLTLTPDSYSGRILEAEEANTLLSAGITALSHLRLAWPLLVPVHDALRDAYRGTAVTAGGAVVHFESDSLHSSSLPERFTRTASQLETFAACLRAHSPEAAALCARAVATVAEPDLQFHHPGALQGPGHDAPLPCDLASKEAAAMQAEWRGGMGAETGNACNNGLRLQYVVRRSYEVPDQRQVPQAGGSNSADRSSEEVELLVDSWDEQAPWRPWAAEDDPVGCLELDVVWLYHSAAGIAAAAADHDAGSSGLPSPLAAAAWRLAAVRWDYERDSGRRALIMLQAADQRRPCLHLQSLNALADGALLALQPPADALPGETSFFSMLMRMAEQWEWVERAQDVGQLGVDQWWQRQGSYLPAAPQSFVLQDAIRDLFQALTLPLWPGSEQLSNDAPDARVDEEMAAAFGSAIPVGKAAPVTSLAARLALHALRLGNPRAVAALWSRFVREVRFAHWEPAVLLPRMGRSSISDPMERNGGPPERPDHRHCLLHQKLQLLQLGIHARQKQPQAQQAPQARQQAISEQVDQEPSDMSGSAASSVYLSMGARSDAGGWSPEGRAADPDGATAAAAPDAAAPQSDVGAALAAAAEAAAACECGTEGGEVAAAVEDCEVPEGVLERLPGLTLLQHPDRPLNVPLTQEAPALTEDSLAERQAALEALPSRTDNDGSCKGEMAMRARLQGTLLLSDMQAFKAANPGCCLPDFIRWHSPRDWVRKAGGGGALSQRMAGEGNAWQALWDGAAAVPSARQRPLFQALLEGERALHFLETLPPAAVYAQLLALGLSSAVALLRAAPAARLPAVQAQLGRLTEFAQRLLQDGVAAWPAGDAVGLGEDGAVGGTNESDTGSAYSSPGPPPSVLHGLLGAGLSRHSVQPLLKVLGCVEQTVAAAQSLLQRLSPGGGAVSGAEEPGGNVAASAANELVAAALGDRCDGVSYGCVAQLSPDERALLAGMMETVSAAEAEAHHNTASGTQWAVQPFSTEWAMEIFAVSGDGGGDTAVLRDKRPDAVNGTGLLPGPASSPLHRLYVKRLPAELRVATSITADA